MNGYDIAPQTTFSSTASTSTTSSTVGTPPATITLQPTSGLSAGTKAGIGAGFAFLALALGALIVFIFAQHKRKRITKGGEPAFNLEDENSSPLMIHKRTYELEGRGTAEAEGREMRAEIGSTH